MKHKDLIKIACKVFGLYFIIQAIINIKDVIFYAISLQFTPKADDSLSFFYTFFSVQVCNFLFNGLAAWILIGKSNFISNKLIKDSNDTSDLIVKKDNLIELIIIGISGYMTIYSLPEILNKIFNYFYNNPYNRMGNKQNISYSIFKLVVGLMVLINAKQISRRLIRIGNRNNNSHENENQ